VLSESMLERSNVSIEWKRICMQILWPNITFFGTQVYKD